MLRLLLNSCIIITLQQPYRLGRSQWRLISPSLVPRLPNLFQYTQEERGGGPEGKGTNRAYNPDSPAFLYSCRCKWEQSKSEGITHLTIECANFESERQSGRSRSGNRWSSWEIMLRFAPRMKATVGKSMGSDYRGKTLVSSLSSEV